MNAAAAARYGPRQAASITRITPEARSVIDMTRRPHQEGPLP